MWIAYFILAVFLAVLLLSLKSGVAYGFGFNVRKKDTPVMYWFQITVVAAVIVWVSYFIINESHH